VRLYYFTSERYGLEALRDNRLKLARIHELNDPFDVIGHLHVPPAHRRMLKKTRDGLHESMGLLCLSTTWKEPLLWGHYADKHKGICLGFDIDTEYLWAEVKYVEHRVAPVFPVDNFRSLIAVKFKAWAYEREWRALIDLSAAEADPVSGHYFMKFGRLMQLREVIVGDRCTVTRAQLARVLGPAQAGVVQKKARPAFNTFEVVEQKLKRAWK